MPNRMGEQCLPGLQGFPIKVSGWPGFTDRSSIETPNDIELQFTPSETPRFMTNGVLADIGSNTFFIGGVQYTAVQVALAQPEQDEGISNFSGPPLAEFQIWGRPSPAYASSPSIAVLRIPIHQKPVENDAGASIIALCTGNPARLSNCIPKGQGTDVIRYSTCIETNRKTTITIQVAYWANGASISQSMVSRIPQAIQRLGIPDLFGYSVLTSFTNELQSSGLQKKIDMRFNKEYERLKPYSTTIGVGSPEFRTGFRLIRNFTQEARGSVDTSAYKCIAINRQRDIKEGKLVVDPRTGVRLDDEVKLVEAQKNESIPDGSAGKLGGNIRMWVCIAIGVLIGTGILAIAAMYIAKWYFNRKGQGLDVDAGAGADIVAGASASTGAVASAGATAGATAANAVNAGATAANAVNAGAAAVGAAGASAGATAANAVNAGAAAVGAAGAVGAAAANATGAVGATAGAVVTNATGAVAANAVNAGAAVGAAAAGAGATAGAVVANATGAVAANAVNAGAAASNTVVNAGAAAAAARAAGSTGGGAAAGSVARAVVNNTAKSVK